MLNDLTEVDSFLSVIATPEYRAMATECLQVFEGFAYTDHAAPLLSAVLVDDTSDHAVVLDNVNGILFEHMDKILQNHHIRLNQDAPLDTYLAVANGIYLMQAWLDKDAIVAMANGDASVEERLAALVNLTTGYSEVKILDSLEEVDDGLLRRLVQVMTDGLPAEVTEEDFAVSKAQLTKLRNFRDFTQDNKLVAFRLVRLGYKVGYEFHRYLDKALATLDSKEGQDLANELVALSLLASDGWSQPIQCWRDKSQALSLDVGERARVDVLLIRTVGDFERFCDARKNNG